MTGFRQKFLKTVFESPRNKFHLEFFNGSHRVSSLVRQFDQINHRLRFFCTIDRSSPLNGTVYLSLYLRYCCNSQEHLWKAFRRTFRICTALSSRKWEDGRYSIFLGRRHNRCPAHSPQTRSCNKNGGVLELFSSFVGTQKIEDLSESKNFFAGVFQIKSRFVLAKKKIWG